MANGGKTPVEPPKKKPTSSSSVPYYNPATKKMVTPKASPAAAKAAPAKRKDQTPKEVYMTSGEILGAKIKKGDYKGAANMFGEAIVGAPKELYDAFKRASRGSYGSGGKMTGGAKGYKAPKGRK